MSDRLTVKQEKFLLDVFAGVNQGQAYLTHYKCKSLAVGNACGARLIKNPKIQKRLREWEEKAISAKVMDVRERRERLSEIGRANLTDYVTPTGIKIDKDSPNSAAFEGITTKIKYYKKGIEPEIVTDVKLHNPIQAIQELNKMDKIYSEGAQVNIDNRSLTINVVSENARKLTELITGGKGTELAIPDH